MRLRVGTEAINFGVRRVVLAASGTLLLAGFVGTTQAAAAGLPRSPSHLGADAKSLKIKPRSIFFTGDGTGLLSGPNAKSKSGIGWTSWTATSALGTGSEQVNNCEPSCAAGKFTAYPVKIEQWRPRSLGGEIVFTRMTIWFTGARPKGDLAHFTFTNLLSDKTFGWSPPSLSGYCVGTHGEKPATGCANIDALPPGGVVGPPLQADLWGLRPYETRSYRPCETTAEIAGGRSRKSTITPSSTSFEYLGWAYPSTTPGACY